ncbi:polysaccharide biosynthesis/export family protein [Fundidesulfovibrio soli]|uniref:polysaccharide biosynthesis/export family protein n=1 Tax=Fundidesulfovibrio soli TaxID=2922716 RepID=UPI001FAF5E41|nr:polysaccharide biosynthesis/export family protein [Fundidesulfovibrio soli]
MNTKTIKILSLLLLVLFMACSCSNGGPRPSMDLKKLPTAPAQPEEVNASTYELGPGDIVGFTFLSRIQQKDDPYLLQRGDTLLVEYHRLEYLNRNIVIRPDGMVSVPYLDELRAADISPSAFSAKLVEGYKRKRIFQNPEITVSVVSVNTQLKEMQNTFTNSTTGQTKEAPVGMDGYIRLPLIEPLFAVNKSVGQIQQEARDAYRRVLSSADVSAELRQIRSNMVYVLGEVNLSGMHNINTPTTVTQAITMAGGYKPGAGLDSVVLIRSDASGQPSGRLVDVASVLKKGNIMEDVQLKRYDVIYVPPSTIQKLNDFILFYVRNMMPFPTSASANVGFSYLWGPASLGSTSTRGTSFTPF